MGLRSAINAYCKSCTYDPKAHGGTWRQQVEACTVTACPLWAVRPRSESAKPRPWEPTDAPDA